MADGKFENGDTKPVVACNLTSIPTADRTRYQELRTRLLTSVVAAKETKKGFVLRFGADLASVNEVSEWIGFERLCCPWISIRIRPTGREGIEVRMSMPQDGKRVVREAFLQSCDKSNQECRS
jgi:hypothetical protein